MAQTKEKKAELVAQYTAMLQNSRALVVTDYRGLQTAELTSLRRKVSEADGRFVVIKNRLFRLAMQSAGLNVPEDFLSGPVAAGFCYGDVPPVAKALTEFAKDSEILVVRGGLLDEKFLSVAEIEALANLPPLEIVRAQLLGLLSSPAANIAGVMASGVRQVVSVIAAYADTGEGPSNGGSPPAEAEAEVEAEATEPEEAEAQAAEPDEAEAQAVEPDEAGPEAEAGTAEAEEADADAGQSE